MIWEWLRTADDVQISWLWWVIVMQLRLANNAGESMVTSLDMMLVGGLEYEFYSFPYIGNNHPNWLRLFRGVETTKQLSSHQIGDLRILTITLNIPTIILTIQWSLWTIILTIHIKPHWTILNMWIEQYLQCCMNTPLRHGASSCFPPGCASLKWACP